MSTLIELDSRRRAPLGRLGNKKHTHYLVDERDDGTLVLSPAVIMTEREASVLADPDLVARIRDGIAEARAGKVSPLDWSMFDGIAEGDDAE